MGYDDDELEFGIGVFCDVFGVFWGYGGIDFNLMILDYDA
jgi:hypothetical protein